MGVLHRQDPDIAEVYDRYSDMLFRIALGQLQNKHDAEDAVQDVYLKYIHHIPSFNNEEHLRSWLIRVTLNVCHDIVRKRNVRAAISIDDIGDIATEDTTGMIDLMNTLSSLPEKYREIIILHYLEGFSLEQITKMLKISLSAAKMRLLRGRQILKDGGIDNA